ncbi:MAG: hypothetical protein CM15mV19_1240 [uncultured marine virus]|nr:MAG: hypothetical protein CM15mV19_1240 [uncultured marine virus]
MGGTKVVDITKFGSGVNRFITNHLPFEILEYFPDVYIDNHFNGIDYMVYMIVNLIELS